MADIEPRPASYRDRWPASHWKWRLRRNPIGRERFGSQIVQDEEFDPAEARFGSLDAQTRELLQEEPQSIWRRQRKTVPSHTISISTRPIVLTARPGRVKADILIPNVERSGDFRKSTEYLALRNQVWDLLREEVPKARALDEQ